VQDNSSSSPLRRFSDSLPGASGNFYDCAGLIRWPVCFGVAMFRTNAHRDSCCQSIRDVTTCPASQPGLGPVPRPDWFLQSTEEIKAQNL